MKPTKKHNGKTITVYFPAFDETVTGVYIHRDGKNTFELTYTINGVSKIGVFERSACEIRD